MTNTSARASSLNTLVNGVGWFSIALGLVELTRSRSLASSMGMENKAALVRTYGLREMLAGVGILLSKSPAPWLWARLAGDALDMAAR